MSLAAFLELLVALARAFGLVASARQARDERAAGAAQQRAEDLKNEALRIQKAVRAGDAVVPRPSGVQDANDRDGTS